MSAFKKFQRPHLQRFDIYDGGFDHLCDKAWSKTNLLPLFLIVLNTYQFRGNWTVNPKTGQYFANFPTPTGIPSDPALVAHGVHQAEQLATALSKISDPPITQIYSSPFYRCLETVQPFAEKSGLEVRGDNGLG